MINFPKKLSCEYTYVKIVNYIYIYILYTYKLWSTLLSNINV